MRKKASESLIFKTRLLHIFCGAVTAFTFGLVWAGNFYRSPWLAILFGLGLWASSIVKGALTRMEEGIEIESF